MGRADDELVVPRLGRDERARPADREPVGLEPLRVGALDAEVEGHLRIDLLVDEVFAAVEVTSHEVLGSQAPLRIDGRAVAAEAGDEVGDDVAILPHGEP